MAGSLSWSAYPVHATVCDVFETVEDLASAVTAVLSPDGPLATLTRTLTDALDSVWAEFFGAATLPGGTNWNAYSHEQLYRMLAMHLAMRLRDAAGPAGLTGEVSAADAELASYHRALRDTVNRYQDGDSEVAWQFTDEATAR
jgi:hypothetical protein